MADPDPTRIYTIGHSTRPIEEFIDRLTEHYVAQLIDIRTVPQSRHNPQYGRDALKSALERHGIGYTHRKDLGGLRDPDPQSVNLGWRNRSFRGYADYMRTDEFQAAIDDVVEIAQRAPTAIMCAEALPWRCHRSLVGDALIVRGFSVLDIMGTSSIRDHELTSFARVNGTDITYP